MTILGVQLCLLMALAAVGAGISAQLQQRLPEVHGHRFYYFSYGSNMLAKSMHTKIPTAVLVGPALLEYYRLDFGGVSSAEWQGALATIVPTVDGLSWGTLWEIDVANLTDLDNQEQQAKGAYSPHSVQVKLQGNATKVPARVYLLNEQPVNNYHDLLPEEVPEERQPSTTYLKVLVKGAAEGGVPQEYVNWLKSIKHNDKKVQETEELLQLHPVELLTVFNKVNTPKMAGKFFYFGFGSNMLASRIHIQNPTAQRIGAGKLKNYRLDFLKYDQSDNLWMGAPATIVPTEGTHVFGAIWEIDMSNLKDLDNQEGVAQGIYQPINVPVYSLATDSEIVCRAYHLTKQPETELHGSPGAQDADKEVPFERKPSETYLKVLVKGAVETGIPDSYVDWLKSLKHNDNTVQKMEDQLELSQVQLGLGKR